MKAIRNYKNKIEYTDIPEPKVDEKFNVLVRVMSVGLCGSDVQRIDFINSSNQEINHPVLGHEISGIIEEIKGDQATFKVGDRVSIEPIIYCSSCKYCTEGNFQFCENIIALGKTINGGFAQKLVVPIQNIHKLQDDIDFDTGTLLDLCSVCVHIHNLAGDFSGKNIAIIGDGAVGLTTALFVEIYNGNATVIGKRTSGDYNFINYLDDKKLKEIESTFDIVIETVGRRNLTSLNQAISLSKIKGKIVVAGVFAPEFMLPITARTLFYKEISLVGANSYSYDHNKSRSETLDAIEILNKHYKKLSSLITHKYPIQRFEDGLNAFRNKDTSHAIKIVFNPN